MDKKKNILITEDHGIVCRGLYYLIMLNFPGCIIHEVASIKEMKLRLPAGNFTHLILDLTLPDGNSIDVLPGLIEQYPQLKILIYSMAPEEVYGRKLLQLRTSGFLSKSADEKEIVRAMDTFLYGGVYISKALKLPEGSQNGEAANNVFHSLSINELRVLGLILKGYKTKAIASDLNVTLQTIATYKVRIFKKLGTENVFDIQKLAELYSINFPG